MLEEKRFIDGIWDKYDFYLNNEKSRDVFFEKHYYKNTDYLLALKTVAMFIIVIMFTMTLIGGVYAGIKYTIEKEIAYEHDESEINDKNSLGYYSVSLSEMDYDGESRIYYKKILSYDEYIKYKNKYNNFIDMKESEFQEHFLLVLVGSTSDRHGIYIENIQSTEDTICVNIGRDEDKSNGVLFAKMLKNDNREMIEIKYFEKTPNMTNYTELKKLPKDYNMKQAIEDKCVVIEGINCISKQDGLKDFIRKSEEGINDNIRIVQYFGDNGIIISDIEAKDGKYIVC